MRGGGYNGEEETLKSIVKAIGFSSLKKSVQDTVISSYNSMSFTHPSDENTHTGDLKGVQTTVLRKKKTSPHKDHTHSRGETYCAYTHHNVLQITAAHTHTHTQAFTGCVKPDGSEE